MLWIKQFLDNRLIDGGKFVNLTRRPRSPQKRCLVQIPVRGIIIPKNIMRLEELRELKYSMASYEMLRAML
jgi:hypothetical protein